MTARPSPLLRTALAMLTTLLAPAGAQAAGLPQEARVPGGVAVIALAADEQPAPTARYRGRRIMVTRADGEWVALVGIPLSAEPGTHRIEVEGDGGQVRHHTFRVRDKEYAEQHLTIKKKGQVNLSKADLRRHRREKKEIHAALHHWRDAERVDLPLSYPVEGIETSPFGLRRFYNGQPRSPHSGIDLAADRGTPLKAPAAGRVVETGHYFFNGKTVFIDHGQGLVTIHCHMDRIDVEKGERVERGQPIGTLGATGRVTGPNLHWGVTLNGHMVDPHLLLEPKAVASSADER